MKIQVLVELSNKNIDKTFTYLVPSNLESFISVGIRVQVPFGNQILEGFVLDINKETDNQIEDIKLKEIIKVVDLEPILNEELLELGKYLKKTTLCTLISAYQIMLPKALKARNNVNINKKQESYIILNDNIKIDFKLNEKQQTIIDILKKEKQVSKKILQEISPSSIKTLLNKNVIKETFKEKYRLEKTYTIKEKHPLVERQQQVVNEILKYKNHQEIFLIHGVTGSGKTEVYMELIEILLKEDKTSIVLVPEISLTEQIVNRFLSRFGNNIAILHSRLSDGEKYDEYRKIAKGEVKIVIGARSAIFAPLKNIGIIIVDEEHTDSYKQQEQNPKYSAIDVAIERSKYHNCPVVLGSATPTLESYARGIKGIYHLISMTKRVNEKPLPKVEIVDLSEEIKKQNSYFSDMLKISMKKTLEKGEQVILLLNKRGYSSLSTCRNCGYTEKCPNCDISLTYHKTNNMLRCHYCGYGTKLKEICPECHEKAMLNLGLGTEKVEEELGILFKDYKVIRMDVDTTSKKGQHEKIIKDFEDKKYSILLGTQMIAKGLDFENVTLVGVINADTSLNIPDFRSSEKTFDLLNQVAGRSGRGEKEGKVIIQTYNKDHYVLKYVKTHDYLGFFENEMKIRRMLSYPPYVYVTLIKIMSKDYETAKNISNEIFTYLKRNLLNSKILGPSVANVFRVNNVYRFQIIIKYKKEESLYNVLEKMDEHYKINNKVKIDIDFNPRNIG